MKIVVMGIEFVSNSQMSPLIPMVGNKFAVGSGAKTVCICYYEQENNW